MASVACPAGLSLLWAKEPLKLQRPHEGLTSPPHSCTRDKGPSWPAGKLPAHTSD